MQSALNFYLLLWLELVPICILVLPGVKNTCADMLRFPLVVLFLKYLNIVNIGKEKDNIQEEAPSSAGPTGHYVLLLRICLTMRAYLMCPRGPC